MKSFVQKFLSALLAATTAFFMSGTASASDTLLAQAGGEVAAADLLKQVVMTEEEVRILLTNKAVTYDGKEYGDCKQDFRANGTFTFLCNGFHDSGTWYFKDHAKEPRRMLCRDYQKQGSNCSSMAKNGKGEFFFGLSLKSQKKVLRTEELNPS